MKVFVSFLALILSFVFVEVRAEGNISIGGISIDGHRIGGIELPPGSHGSIHYHQEIQRGFGGNIEGAPPEMSESIQNEEMEIEGDFNNPPTIKTPKENVQGGFASTMAKKLLKQQRKNGQSE